MEKNFHPDILALEETTVDVSFSRKENLKYCGRSDRYYVVPTDMVVSRALDRDLWKGCPNLVNYDILQCIEEVVASGQYPYNAEVGELFSKKFGLGRYVDAGTFLSAMVYCTQSYRHAVEDEKNAIKEAEVMTANGFRKLSEEDMKALADTRKYVEVVVKGTNILCQAVQNTMKARLVSVGGQYMWMKPRATRQGFWASTEQYVKL